MSLFPLVKRYAYTILEQANEKSDKATAQSEK